MKIRDLAKEACERFVDPQEARDFVRPKLEAALVLGDDPELYETAMAMVISDCCKQARGEASQIVRGVRSGLPPQTQISDDLLDAKVSAANHRLLDQLKIGSKYTGDCLGVELDPEIAATLDQLGGVYNRLTWLKWLRARTADQSRVRDCVTSDEADSEWRKIRQELAGGPQRRDTLDRYAARKPSNNGRTGHILSGTQNVDARRPQKRKRGGQDSCETQPDLAAPASTPAPAIGGKAAS